MLVVTGALIASRVMNHATRGGILVSGTVKDPVVGSGIDFGEDGAVKLQGVPGEWQVHDLRSLGH